MMADASFDVLIVFRDISCGLGTYDEKRRLD